MPFHLFVGERKHLFSISIGIRFASIRRLLNDSIIYIQSQHISKPVSHIYSNFIYLFIIR